MPHLHPTRRARGGAALLLALVLALVRPAVAAAQNRLLNPGFEGATVVPWVLPPSPYAGGKLPGDCTFWLGSPGCGFVVDGLGWLSGEGRFEQSVVTSPGESLRAFVRFAAQLSMSGSDVAFLRVGSSERTTTCLVGSSCTLQLDVIATDVTTTLTFGLRRPTATRVEQVLLFDDAFLGTVVPEPATLTLVGAGLLGLGAVRRRRAG